MPDLDNTPVVSLDMLNGSRLKAILAIRINVTLDAPMQSAATANAPVGEQTTDRPGM